MAHPTAFYDLQVLKIGRDERKTRLGMEEDEREVIKDVFGSSSDSDEEALSSSRPSSSPTSTPVWAPVDEIKGLWLCTDFLSSDQQFSLLSSIDEEGWFDGASRNQAMRFGDLPSWAIELSRYVREELCMASPECKMDDVGNDANANCVMPSRLLWRDPLFDQLICNVYQPGEGICAHVDLMRFEDGIAIVSLESPCVMHFSRAEPDAGGAPEPGPSTAPRVPVYLTPGSLVIMWGEARYLWKHEINRKLGFQVWRGLEIDQKRRTSITLRKLCGTS